MCAIHPESILLLKYRRDLVFQILAWYFHAHRDGRSSEGQAEQHQQGDDLVVGIDVRQTQAAVVAVKTRLHRLEHICPLKEVQAYHR